MRAAAYALGGWLALAVAGCGGGEARTPVEVGSREEVHPYQFDALDERQVSREAFAGKPTVLVFLTTWDIASQAQVGIVLKIAEREGKELNVAIVALHERHERELVEAYVRSVKWPHPVALSDAETRVGRGPLGDVHMIPTVLVIDREGRLVKKHVGVTKAPELRESIEAAKAGAAVGVH